MRRLVLFVIAGLALAGCGVTNVSAPASDASATPSLTMSVPFTLSTCTLEDRCLTLGTTGLATSPTSAGQVWSDGHWQLVATPSAPNTTLTSASCGSTNCLILGQSATGPVLWRWTGQDVTVAAVPAGVTQVWGVGCAATCYAVTATNGTPALWDSNDDGLSWQLDPKGLDPATSPTGPLRLACQDHNADTPTCYADLSSTLALTSGGATAGTVGFITVTSAASSPPACATFCFAVLARHGRAYALTQLNASTGYGVNRVRATLSSNVSDLACRDRGCVGLSDKGSVLLQRHRHFVTASLRYFVGAPESVACGRSICVVNSATTVAVLR